MTRKRSRPATEARFRDAVRDLVAEQGCGGLGVNSIADRAGADKVLIYRYFGDLEGLLAAVADDRPWLPAANEVLAALPATDEGARVLEHCARTLRRSLESDPAASRLMRWRRAVDNPLTRPLNEAWNRLWKQLAEAFAQDREWAERERWQQACRLAALLTESALNGDSLDAACFERIAGDLTAAALRPPEAAHEANAPLPTNLL